MTISYTIQLFCSLDINECETNEGGCEHICNNTMGSFECLCQLGFNLASNGLQCNGIILISLLLYKRLLYYLIQILMNVSAVIEVAVSRAASIFRAHMSVHVCKVTSQGAMVSIAMVNN